MGGAELVCLCPWVPGVGVGVLRGPCPLGLRGRRSRRHGTGKQNVGAGLLEKARGPMVRVPGRQRWVLLHEARSSAVPPCDPLRQGASRPPCPEPLSVAGDQPLCSIPIENILAVERLEEESFKMKNVSAAPPRALGVCPSSALVAPQHPLPLPSSGSPVAGCLRAGRRQRTWWKVLSWQLQRPEGQLRDRWVSLRQILTWF